MSKESKTVFLLLTLVLMFVLTANSAAAQAKNYFGNWERGTSPKEVGKRLAENFAARKFEFETGKREFVIYPEVCAWYGALTISKLINDKDLNARLIQKFDQFLTTAGAKHISAQAHVDYRVFGITPLEIYIQNKDRKYLAIGQNLADQQWGKTTQDGITEEARYWVDDMYMITAVQTQAYRATGEIKYLDRAALAATAYLDKLQQPNGLFFHAPDAQFYWGRGNGWFAAGMAELLRALPKNHPKRGRILQGYKTMMASLLKYQSENGLWRQLIDAPESWEETSGTGMFAFAMITGVKEGWLEAKIYGPAARKAWLGLVKRLDKDANISDVCEGTNKGYSVQYYLDRQRKTGDLHGQSPLLWSATALLR